MNAMESLFAVCKHNNWDRKHPERIKLMEKVKELQGHPEFDKEVAKLCEAAKQ